MVAEITGFYIRIQRDGKWQSLDIAELTDNELLRFIGEMDGMRAGQWVMSLAKWIRDNVQEASNEHID